MNERELKKQIIPASLLDTKTIVERESMRGRQFASIDKVSDDGKLIFRQVIKEGRSEKSKKVAY